MNAWKAPSATRRASFLAAGSLLLSMASSASAGTFGIKVANVQIVQDVLYPGQSTTLSYTLTGSGVNAAGGLASVKIQYLNGTTVVKEVTIPAGSPGAKAGANTYTINAADVPSGGPYTVRILAVGGTVTGTGYIPVSSSADPYLQFYNPRGVAVNKVTGSATKGRVYVTEGGGGTTANRTTVDGVYILNPDLTPAFATPKATSADIGALGPWAASNNSPFRPIVTPEGNILITDGSDPHCALFTADANGDNVKAFFAYPFPAGGSRDNNLVYDSSGNPIHGSVTNVVLEGTGAGRVIYTSDEDVTPGNSIQKYATGTGTQDLAVLPTQVTAFSGVNWYEDFVRDSAGNTYLVSDAVNDANKLDSAGNVVATLPATGTAYLSTCIDEAHDMILIGGEDGTVYKTTKAYDTVTPLFTGLGTNVRGLAIDAESWVYALCSGDEQLHVWAPAGTYTVPPATTDAAQTLTVVGTPTPGDVSPVGPTGLFTGPNGRKYGDAKVTIQDAVAVLRIAAGLDTVP